MWKSMIYYRKSGVCLLSMHPTNMTQLMENMLDLYFCSNNLTWIITFLRVSIYFVILHRRRRLFIQFVWLVCAAHLVWAPFAVCRNGKAYTVRKKRRNVSIKALTISRHPHILDTAAGERLKCVQPKHKIIAWEMCRENDREHKTWRVCVCVFDATTANIKIS